jgi:hypothetical protein
MKFFCPLRQKFEIFFSVCSVLFCFILLYPVLFCCILFYPVSSCFILLLFCFIQFCSVSYVFPVFLLSPTFLLYSTCLPSCIMTSHPARQARYICLIYLLAFRLILGHLQNGIFLWLSRKSMDCLIDMVVFGHIIISYLL